MSCPRIVALLFLLLALPALAQLPARDLLVELRQTDVPGPGSSVATQSREARLAPQKIQVRNGVKAVFSLGQSVPLQWVRSVATQSAALKAPGVQASSRGGAASQSLTWMDSGQKITVLPRWPGGQQAVTVDVEVQAAAVQQGNGTELPAQTRSLLVTTVTAQLGQWVTLATIGGSLAGGVYSSESAGETRSFLQIRLSTP
jgi:hypothetical protein